MFLRSDKEFPNRSVPIVFNGVPKVSEGVPIVFNGVPKVSEGVPKVLLEILRL